MTKRTAPTLSLRKGDERPKQRFAVRTGERMDARRDPAFQCQVLMTVSEASSFALRKVK
ncbi:hypothetical protein [Pseudoalteromonas luteoviolacea]|uniref:Uncharacterized protein n=1 Tax=Pseudoalteromonas luteoviolacea NCIMB 1942 TaxID=1365253 RepID=A0A167HEL1_9GAMM|nr:hypothetical protein [Pseudoalteromonas luteoviolacea]KZN58036.1 hypothetical protein N482_22675 [Pseudoalteromonas luteoviolacea NCIMB 1942]